MVLQSYLRFNLLYLPVISWLSEFTQTNKRVEVKPQTTIDNELITEAQKGNQKAIAALMQKYQKSVYHLILRIVKNSEDAEKLVHESFARAFANMSQYSSQFSYSTWLFKIASNTSIDFLRRKRIEELAA